jgi:tripartite-type tricarboxylate transporter receptor subunit TctC
MIVPFILISFLVSGCSSNDLDAKGNGNEVDGNGDFPDKDITLTVPFAAGDTPDLIGRILADFMGDDLGVNIIVQNKPGSGGTVGHNEVSKKKADGYSMIIGNSGALTISPFMREVGYDSADFEPIGLLSENPITIIVNKDSEFNTIEEFITYAKEHPGEIEYGTPGAGVPQHIMMETLIEDYDIDIKHIPQDGGNEVVASVLGNHVDVGVIGANVVGEQIKNGELKSLGVTIPFPPVTEIETFEAQGYDITATTWFGLFVPVGIPEEVKSMLSDSLVAAFDDQSVIESWEKLNINPVYQNSEELLEKIKASSENNKEIIEKIGLSK